MGTAAQRADIEGLRGIAVLSVFAVHSVPHALRGGFVGVDVFFVLSGYLVASITLREIDAGTYSAAAFYVRRVRRLLPALCVVLATCLVFALCLAVPKDAMEIGKHVAGGAAFISNFVLWREAGYFDPASESKPLLHLWSLGIEEQFYLLWPLFALLAARSRRRAVLLIALAALASFMLNVAYVGLKPKGTFFLPPTRLWELLTGVLLACAPAWPQTRAWRDGAAVAGVVLLAAALALITRTDQFPGWWALFPTLGTVLLLAAGPQAWINRRVLAQPVLGFYGRISYPLYLWHWPLLTFPLLLDHPVDRGGQILLLCLSVGLAALTHVAVERPLRRNERAAPLLVAAMAGMGALGLALWAGDGWPGRYPAAIREIAAAEVRTDYAAYRVERCFLRSEQGPGDFAAECAGAGRPQLLIWGDSHAAALYPGLHALHPQADVAQFTAALCPPLLAPSPRHAPRCAEVNRAVLDIVARLRPNTVVLGGYWARYQQPDDAPAAEIGGLRHTVQRLRELGVAQVVVVGPLPEWRIALPRLLLAEWSSNGSIAERRSEGFVAHALVVDEHLQALLAGSGAIYVSAIHRLCNASGCLVTSSDDGAGLRPMAFDSSHLSSAGSRQLAASLLAVTAPGSPHAGSAP